MSPHSVSADPRSVPVVVVGAGPVGLITSILLSRYGVRHLLLEKRDRVSELPRARGLTVRSCEILGQLGLGAELDGIAQSELWSSAFVYTETLGGRIIGHMPGAMAPGASAAFSPARYVVAAQDRIDPMLFEAARASTLAELRFGAEVVGFEQDGDGITLAVRGSDGAETLVRAEYAIACDGGKSPLRAMAGIGETGRANLRSFINNFVRADLSRFTKGREGALIWTLEPGLEGVFQMLDEKERWAIQVQYDPATFDIADWTDDRAKRHIRAMIGVPEAEDVEIEILRSYGYTISMMLADRLVQGRLILAGDAAHTIPPYGGFGLNTGLQTAHNLVWKLVAVLRGEAGAAILGSYDQERREVAQRVGVFGRTNAGFIEQLMTAVREAGSFEQKRAILAGSKQYGNWWGLDLGMHYERSGAFVADQVAPPAVDDQVIDYIPHAKPGYRAPHVRVRRGSEQISIIALLHGDFVLLAGPDGRGWIDAIGGDAAPLSPAVIGYRVASDGDLVPDGEDFCALYGIGPSGAVIVRPDGMVAYRSAEIVDDPRAAIEHVLDTVLYRVVEAPPARAIASMES